MSNLIQIGHLCKRFGPVQAVDDLSFRVKEGELFAFLGVNGAGKSTTINILCGQLAKDSGTVTICGTDLDADANRIKQSLGVVFQSSVLDKDLSVQDNLRSRAALYGIHGKAFRDRLTELAVLLDFQELLKRPVGKLSGGQRRRIDIARALLHRPKVLVLDEPTTGLDPQTRNLLWQVVGATLRPNVTWNKTAWLYSDSGNNGKGTLCTLMRNLLGDGAWASLPLKAFSNPFMLEPLSRVSAIITDENDTGTFVDAAAALKSIITHDPFLMDRKFKDPHSVLFNGFMVQCVNELPKLRDKSESLYRRLLVIPFEKRFEGRERKYIKDDYLKRKDVLEYVLYKLLATTDYYELDVPQTCIDMLEEFKLENDPVRQFAEEVFAEATWDLLPYKFMYDCYRHWFQRNVPSGRPVGRNAFLKSLKGLAAEYGWLAQDKVRSDGRMDRPEPLILEYDVREWMNSGYTGSDPGRKCMPDLAESYRGFVRVSTAGSDDGRETDSEDKED